MTRISKTIGAAVALALAGGLTASAQAVLRMAPRVETSGATYHVATCPGPTPHGVMRCYAHIVTDRGGNPLANRFKPNRFERHAKTNLVPQGFGPTELNSAYHPSVVANYPTGVGSSSTIVAVVDAYGYPNAEADLAIYRSTYGLPACTTANGCFTKYNETGQTTNYPRWDLGWAQETALDLDMASAMCPNCKIILVEADNEDTTPLGTAVNTAVAKGAHVVSNSYGGDETSAAFANHRFYAHPGVAITASTGDDGYGAGPSFPATSPDVVAVGGTTLTQVVGGRGWTESAWRDGGSGCSAVFPKPTWQASIPLCTMRMEADVSAVGNPDTGVAVYGPLTETHSVWAVYGGTSVSAPLVAGLFGANGHGVTLASPYRHTANLNDVTTGHNGSCGGTLFCTAGTGYDGPTGLGTPNGDTAF